MMNSHQLLAQKLSATEGVLLGNEAPDPAAKESQISVFTKKMESLAWLTEIRIY